MHSKDINRLALNKDRTLLLTCSKDHTAKLLNADTLQVRFFFFFFFQIKIFACGSVQFTYRVYIVLRMISSECEFPSFGHRPVKRETQ